MSLSRYFRDLRSSATSERSARRKPVNYRVEKIIEDSENVNPNHPSKRKAASLKDSDRPLKRRKVEQPPKREFSRRARPTNLREKTYTDDDLEEASEEEVQHAPKIRPTRSAPESESDDDNVDDRDTQEEFDSDDDTAPSKRQPTEGEVDKIIAMKPKDDAAASNTPRKTSKYLYLVKFKNQSYLHVAWLSAKEVIERGGQQAANRIRSFTTKHLAAGADGWSDVGDVDTSRAASASSTAIAGVYFDPNYVEIDRLVDVRDGDSEDDREYLVKWKSLPYSECTWESAETVEELDEDGSKRELFELFNQAPTAAEVRAAKQFAASGKLERPDRDDVGEVSKLEPPKFRRLDLKLRDYQVDGFRWLVQGWLRKTPGILADEMGLGKTIQTVAFLTWLRTGPPKCRGPFLIVAPLSTLYQWQSEFETWAGHKMNAIVYHGDAKSRDIIRKKEFYFSGSQSKQPIYKFHVLITTYEMVLADDGGRSGLSSIEWAAMVIDEGHRIKNKASRLFERLSTSFSADHRVLLTGTPLQNSLGELWAMLHFLEPRRFHSNTQKEFEKSFERLAEGREGQLEELKKLLQPYLLRRLKEDVEASIPKKEEIVVEIELTAVQKAYYRAILDRNREFLCRSSRNAGSEKAAEAQKRSLNNIMMELRKCCNHPYLIKGAESQILEDYGASDEAAVHELLIKTSSKLVFLDKLLAKLRAEGHKVLIFSQMTSLLDILEDYLRLRKYRYERLDGGVARADRHAAISRFSNPVYDRFVFLLCTRAGGVGLNLTAADTVVIFDSDWNPQNDLQAQARCHRIGQTNEVKVYRLLTRNTYEATMFVTASKKLGLSGVVLGMAGRSAADDSEADNSDDDSSDSTLSKSSSGLTREECARLLKYGAYTLFRSSASDDKKKEKELFEADIDDILQSASTVTYGGASSSSSSKQDGFIHFSKANFCSSAEDAAIDMDDEDFWEKVLPEYKSTRSFMEKLRRAAELSEAEKNEFFEALPKLIDQVKASSRHRSVFSSFDPLFELNRLLAKINELNDVFSDKQRAQAREWQEALSGRRRVRMCAEEQAAKEAAMRAERKEKAEKTAREEAFSREAKREKRRLEWNKAQRDRMRMALLEFGWGRWEDICRTAALDDAKGPEDVCAFAENFSVLLARAAAASEKKAKEDEKEEKPKKTGEDKDADIAQSVLDWTQQQCRMQRCDGASADVTVTLGDTTNKYQPGQKIPLKVAEADANVRPMDVDGGDSAGTVGLLLVYEYSADKSFNVRVVSTRIGVDTVIFAPGFPGRYVVRRDSDDAQTTLAEFFVEEIPQLVEESFAAMLQRSARKWANRMLLLMKLNELIAKYGKGLADMAHAPRLPSVTKPPAVWWRTDVDDLSLLRAVVRYGFGRTSEMCADEALGWGPAAIASRLTRVDVVDKPKADTGNVVPESEDESKQEKKDEQNAQSFPPVSVINKRAEKLILAGWKELHTKSAPPKSKLEVKHKNDKPSKSAATKKKDAIKQKKGAKKKEVDKKQGEKKNRKLELASKCPSSPTPLRNGTPGKSTAKASVLSLPKPAANVPGGTKTKILVQTKLK